MSATKVSLTGTGFRNVRWRNLMNGLQTAKQRNLQINAVPDG